jgi:hypothetical protein
MMLPTSVSLSPSDSDSYLPEPELYPLGYDIISSYVHHFCYGPVTMRRLMLRALPFILGVLRARGSIWFQDEFSPLSVGLSFAGVVLYDASQRPSKALGQTCSWRYCCTLLQCHCRS